MAHFAELDENNVVTRVIVVANEELLVDGIESEAKGIEFCKSLLGNDTNWAQTSYNATMRKNYAGSGYTFDSERDAFITPKPFASWVLDEETCNWDAPVAHPEDDKFYNWDEDTLSWIEVTPA